MRINRRVFPGLAMMTFGALAAAQVDTGKPADATALCKDGTFYSGKDQASACKANGGVQEWWGTVNAPKDVPDRQQVKEMESREREKAPKRE